MIFERSLVGIDIGFESIKIVAVKHRRKNPEVVGYVEIPLSGPIIESDHIKDKQAIADQIKKGLKSAIPHSISTRLATTVMPEFLVFSKTLQLPKVENEKEMKMATLSQASKYIPVSMTDVNIDSEILITHPDEPVTDVLIAATPKALVDDYIDMFNMAGLSIVAIETKTIAASRAVVPPNSNLGLLILEIGTVSSRISIVDKGKIRFVLTINTGGDQVIRQIADSGLSKQDFLKHKYQQGIKDQISTAQPIIQKIVDDLVKAIRYHQTRDYKASRISKILLCGSGGLIPGMAKAIEDLIKIEVEAARFYLNKIPTGLDQRYSVALGLALNSSLDQND